LYVFRNLEEPALPVYSAKGHKEIINAIDGVGGLGIGEGNMSAFVFRCSYLFRLIVL